MATTMTRPPEAPPPPPRRASPLRGLLLVGIVAVLAGLVALATTRTRTAELGGTVAAIDGPLTLRSQAATVALGDGRVLVWGGRNTSPDSGAVFDPSSGTWELLPPAPGPSRFSAAAVWTGTEAIIWGGSTRSDRFTPDPGGIAWNPTTRSWRELPAAPLALMDARAVAFESGILITGGRRIDSSEPVDLWFDRADEAWAIVPNDIQVLNVAWQQGHLVGTGPVIERLLDGHPTWAVLAFDELTRTWSQGAPELEAGWLALASTADGQLTAVSSDSEQLRGYVLTNNQWVEAAGIRSSAVVTIEPRGYAPATVWTGERLVLGAQGGLAAWDPETRQFATLDDQRVRTFGGTVVWTGSEIVSLTNQSSEGWIWSPPPGLAG